MAETTPNTKNENGETSFWEFVRRMKYVFTPKELRREESAFYHPWDDTQCFTFKTEVEAKPEGIDFDAIVRDAYTRLVSLLGPHQREYVSLTTINYRVICSDPDTLFAFEYLYDQPGENSTKFWANPTRRAAKTRGFREAFSLRSTRAACYNLLGIVMIPNNPRAFSSLNAKEMEYANQHSIQPNDFPLLELKRLIAHELAHYLFKQRMCVRAFLTEPLTDYIATCVYPEIIGADVQYAWARASIQAYLEKLGFKDISDFIRTVTPGSQYHHDALEAALEVRKKYYPKVSYVDLGMSEDILNKIGFSKYTPIPE